LDISVGNYRLSGLQQISVVLGKNGCGKSTLLRTFDEAKKAAGYVQYVTPERGGELVYDGGVDSARQNPSWLSEVRRRNSTNNFRQLSVSEFRRLETLVLRKIESDPKTRADLTQTFESTLALINDLLDQVQIVRHDVSFKVASKKSGEDRSPNTLSSGESELISLAIEILAFSYMSQSAEYKDKENWLLFDEPDVHLHPDLQFKLMKLLVSAEKEGRFRTLICTHSTAILGALADERADVSVAFMRAGQKELKFQHVTNALTDILPVFGAHPLSNVFAQRPILLVEGEDDHRVWQQAVRTSEGRIRVWPCHAGDIQSLNEYEQRSADIIGAVYDNARAYSLRDRDESPYEINDLGPVIRARLECRAAENLIVSDDVLTVLGGDWNTLVQELDRWLQQNPTHKLNLSGEAWKQSGWNRKDADIKELRNLIPALLGSSKPWEVAVGQGIAWLKTSSFTGPNCLLAFLGPKVVTALSLR
jgi:energy-coupling factor transporter ATP-binding protein EcfA2